MDATDPDLRIPTACDSDPARQQLLATAIVSAAVQKAALAFKPPLVANWQPGIFELAAAVRANLPVGLAAGDFDGANVAQALDPPAS